MHYWKVDFTIHNPHLSRVEDKYNRTHSIIQAPTAEDALTIFLVRSKQNGWGSVEDISWISAEKKMELEGRR